MNQQLAGASQQPQAAGSSSAAASQPQQPAQQPQSQQPVSAAQPPASQQVVATPVTLSTELQSGHLVPLSQPGAAGLPTNSTTQVLVQGGMPLPYQVTLLPPGCPGVNSAFIMTSQPATNILGQGQAAAPVLVSYSHQQPMAAAPNDVAAHNATLVTLVTFWVLSGRFVVIICALVLKDL